MKLQASSRTSRLEPTRPRPFRTVLVATNLSDDGAALARALALPLADDANVHLFHVIDGTRPSHLSAPERLRRLDDEAAAAVGNSPPGRASPPTIVRRLAWGDPAWEIALEARRTATGLIVLGPPGSGDGRCRPLARQLLGMTGCPVLVAASVAPAAYRRPLVATDLGLADIDLLLLASRITAGSAETIRVLHAFEVGFEGRRGLLRTGPALTPWGERFRSAAASRLVEFLGAAPVEGVTWSPETEPAPPADAILRRVGDADLVVLGNRARLGLDRLVYGCVAEELLGRLPCDLLIGRPDRCESASPSSNDSSGEPR